MFSAFTNVKLIGHDGRTLLALAALIDNLHVATSAEIDVADIASVQFGDEETIPVMANVGHGAADRLKVGEHLRLVPLAKEVSSERHKPVCLPELEEQFRGRRYHGKCIRFNFQTCNLRSLLAWRSLLPNLFKPGRPAILCSAI
jgi:hypothetical protein